MASTHPLKHCCPDNLFKPAPLTRTNGEWTSSWQTHVSVYDFSPSIVASFLGTQTTGLTPLISEMNQNTPSLSPLLRLKVFAYLSTREILIKIAAISNKERLLLSNSEVLRINRTHKVRLSSSDAFGDTSHND